MREIDPSNRFCLYGEAWKDGITLADLLALQKESGGDLLARVENSGSEGLYCEVARWNEPMARWERFAHYKYLANPDQDARDAANAINDAAWHRGESRLIHNMPDWNSARNEVPA